MSLSRGVNVGNVVVGGDAPLVLIAGPDVIEDEDLVVNTAHQIREICKRVNVPYIFKSSYLKDNRTSIHSFVGPGLDEGLRVLARIKEELQIPVTSDVHGVEQVAAAAEVLDLLQIPAFLCKQTSLIRAVAKTGKPINVKKGQFLDASGMKHIIEKITTEGNSKILLTERGTSFGYYDTINDFRSLAIMKSYGYPVVYDVAHSVRAMNVPSHTEEGGFREFAPYLCRAAVAVGCDALFIEVHPEPATALCDAASQWPLNDLASLLKDLKKLNDFVREELPGLPDVTD